MILSTPPAIARIASLVAGKPIIAVCLDSHTYADDARAVGLPDATAYSVPGSGVSVFPEYLCEDAMHVGRLNYARALLVIAHEAGHAAGEPDEAIVECNAWRWMPRLLLRSPHRRAMLDEARYTHRHTPETYQSIC